MVLRLFVFATIALFFSCSSMERDNPIDQNGDNLSLRKCEDRFNPATHFCYDGVIYALCNGMDYNPTAYYCDSPVVRIAKCGYKEYNPLVNECCGSTIFELSNQRCNISGVVETKCGTGWYDSTNQRCNSDSVIETKCGDAWYDAKYQKCQNNVIETQCGTSWYNAVNQICQDSIILTRCGIGNNYHNPETQFCNYNNVVDKCNGEEFDPTIQICQSDVILTRCGTGNNYHNPETQFCYGDDVIDKCNGKNFYPVTQRCQDNIVETQCGSNWYNAENQMCGSGDVILTGCNITYYENGGTSGSYYNPETSFCFDNAVFNKCGGEEYDPVTKGCRSNIITPKCGVGWYFLDSGWYDSEMQGCCNNNMIFALSYQRCQDNIVETLCGSNWYNKYSQYCLENNVVDKEEFTDNRDGKIYKYVIIGEQVWMAENLNYDVEGSKCYNDSIAYCNKYGKLYSWAMADTACPNGWHLPSEEEWNTLKNYIENDNGCTYCEAKYLNATSGWRRCSPSGSGYYSSLSYSSSCEDTYGFAALPGGSIGEPCGGQTSAGEYGYWWSATESTNSSNARCQSLGYDYSPARLWGYDKVNLYSVRCVRD